MRMDRDFLQTQTGDILRHRVRQFLSDLKITDVPIDVEEVARACGLQVKYINRGKGFDGQLLKERRLIEVQADVHPHRQRFTIAHEIGHHVLGHNPVVCAFDDRASRDPRKTNEKQAQLFAAELLMPDALLRKYWTELKRDYKAMAQKFYVSEQAMFLRLDEAGLLGLEPRL